MDNAHTTTQRGLSPYRRPPALARLSHQIDRAEQELRRTFLLEIEPEIDKAERALRRLGRDAADGAARMFSELATALQDIAHPLYQGWRPAHRAAAG